MTNRERAQKVFDEIHEPFYNHKPQKKISVIERALDEAEKRGRDDYESDLIRESVKIDRRHYVEGQREMRERAMNVPKAWVDSKSCGNHDENPCCHVRLADTILGMIRALPIEGE